MNIRAQLLGCKRQGAQSRRPHLRRLWLFLNMVQRHLHRGGNALACGNIIDHLTQCDFIFKNCRRAGQNKINRMLIAACQHAARYQRVLRGGNLLQTCLKWLRKAIFFQPLRRAWRSSAAWRIHIDQRSHQQLSRRRGSPRTRQCPYHWRQTCGVNGVGLSQRLGKRFRCRVPLSNTGFTLASEAQEFLCLFKRTISIGGLLGAKRDFKLRCFMKT